MNAMIRAKKSVKTKRCPPEYILALKDTLNVINGKWKLAIIGSLMYGKKRFKELGRELPHITARMLSRELKDLELNGVVIRIPYDTNPIKVEYELTKSGKTFHEILTPMIRWGLQHRKRSIKPS